MALSVVDLYRDVLPRTNCGDCGFNSCLAFAGMVVAEKHPLDGCPHLAPEVVERCNQELGGQYAAGKWTKRDLAEDALTWARERSASMRLVDLPERIGGHLTNEDGEPALHLPYYTASVIIRGDDIVRADGAALTRWEKVFIYNHMAQGGRRMPTGKWKGFEEFPNTVSKVKTMAAHVEAPLVARFCGRIDELRSAAAGMGGEDATGKANSADVAVHFHPFPRVPVMLLFWDEDPEDGFGATAKLLFDETVIEHLDIESIVFLSERLRQMLCDAADEGA
ncbi:DUF3786 domain-containing protein [Desulfosarcina ovata]|uniref:4Fe-4S domain-containing protein n=1 Tax=Desulfosarcina ovata subsp. ovata TaxID=2752305 RepID=A0A5K8AEP9_9BACT|nr:DUF3786 domain-containing protein [Desulfosarcina ovata]BBO90958.1 hypothetical protein DSCOOX_41380 [Desulfosarcina ovata subsp. ovata]